MCIYIPIFIEGIKTRFHAARDVVRGVDDIHKIDKFYVRHDATADIGLSARRRPLCGFADFAKVSMYMCVSIFLSRYCRIGCDRNAADAPSDVASSSACYGGPSFVCIV